MLGEKIIGASGPGHRVFILAGWIGNKSVSCYTMDLSRFKVKKTSKDSSCDCHKVKLSSKRKAKEEKLVFGERVFARGHYHDDDDDDELTSPVFIPDCRDSSMVALDDRTMYCISYCEDSKHAHGSETLVQKIRLVDGGGGVEVERCLLPTICPTRHNPKTLVLDGKLYVFGGLPPPSLNNNEYPWSEFMDPVTGRWEVFTASPPSNWFYDRVSWEFHPIVYKSKVLIISPRDGNLFLHDVDHPTGWKHYVSTDELSSFHSPPVLVGSTIYWIDKHIYAYDFERNESFSGHFPGYDLGFMTREIHDEQRCLLHIGGDADDVFCLVWEDTSGYSIHFTRIRITKDYDDFDPLNTWHCNRIHVSVISCSSKFTQGTHYLRHVSHALLPGDIVGGGMEDVMVGSACEEMPNKDALVSASVLKRCKNRSVDSEEAFSQKEGTPDSEFVRSKNVKLETACKQMPNKDSSGSASVRKRSKKRSVDSEKALSHKEDALHCEVVVFKKPRVYFEKSLSSKEDDASDKEVIGSPVVFTRYEKSKGKKKKMQEQ